MRNDIINHEFILSEEKKYEFCEETAQLARGVKVGLMLLAERLYRIREQKLYKPTYEQFYLYCQEIEMHESVASRLISIFERFVLELQMPFEEIKKVEYTKLYEIRKVADTKEIAQHWIDKVNSPDPSLRLSYRDLKAQIKAFQNLGSEEEKCPTDHSNTYLVRICRECGESWEELPDFEHTHHEEN